MVNLNSLKKVSVYIAASYFLCFLFICDYANAYGDVFETVTALANSSAFVIMAVNVVIATHCLLWKVVQAIFFGKLYAAELVALKGSVPFLLAECVIVCLLSNSLLGSAFPIFLLLTFIARLFHCLSDERLVTLSTLPAGPDRARKVGRLGLFLVAAMGIDYCASAYMLNRVSYEHDKAKRILLYYLAVMFIQMSMSDVRQAFKLLYQQLVEDRTSLFFFVEKFFEISEPLVAIVLFAYVWLDTQNAPGLLFHSISKHVVGLCTNVKALQRYIMLARRVKCLSDASEEDLARDPVCTICYDQMELGQHCKVLPCGHVYHSDCLRHWFETRGTCPYCRASVLQKTAEARTAAAPPPAPPPDVPHQEQPQPQPLPQEPAVPRHEIHAGDQGGNPVLTENELLNAYGQYLAFLRQQQEVEAPAEAEGVDTGAAPPPAAAVAEASTAAPSPPTLPAVDDALGSPSPKKDVREDATTEPAVMTTPLRASAAVSLSLSPSSSPRRYLATDRRAARTEVEKAFDTFFAEVEEAQNRLLENVESAYAKR